MIKANSLFILNEFAKIINETIASCQKDGQIKTPLQKQALGFEAQVLAFWVFQKMGKFFEECHKLLLDQMHNEFYDELKSRGFDSKMRQGICDDLNLRYKTYNEAFGAGNIAGVATKFARFLAERSKINSSILDIKGMFIPLYLIEEIMNKCKEWQEEMENLQPPL